jgi:HPt (histidine-containing phosphotransfer) domain-containing protein
MSGTGATAMAVSQASELRRRRPIDLVHLARQTMGNRDLELEILKLFDTQLEGQVTRIKSTDKSEDLALPLHTIKGMALGVGARAIEELARRAEQQVTEDGALAPELLADLEVAVAEAHAFILDMLEA